MLRIKQKGVYHSPLQKILKKAREERNWSQRKLGERAGVSGGAISKIELQTMPPSRKTLRRICFALDLEYSEVAAVAYSGEKSKGCPSRAVVA